MRLPHYFLLTCPRLKDELVSIQCAIAYQTTPLMYAAKEPGVGSIGAKEDDLRGEGYLHLYGKISVYLFKASLLAEGLTSR